MGIFTFGDIPQIWYKLAEVAVSLVYLKIINECGLFLKRDVLIRAMTISQGIVPVHQITVILQCIIYVCVNESMMNLNFVFIL